MAARQQVPQVQAPSFGRGQEGEGCCSSLKIPRAQRGMNRPEANTSSRARCCKWEPDGRWPREKTQRLPWMFTPPRGLRSPWWAMALLSSAGYPVSAKQNRSVLGLLGQTGKAETDGRSCQDCGKPPQGQQGASGLNPPAAARDPQRFLGCVCSHRKSPRSQRPPSTCNSSSTCPLALFRRCQSCWVLQPPSPAHFTCWSVGLPQGEQPQLQPVLAG